MYHIISLGGGIQSTTMLLMACLGELTPKPICAIFADTGWERQQTYKTVKFLTAYAEEFQIPVHTVSNGNIRTDSVAPEIYKPPLPFFLDGGRKMLSRQCTYNYKIRPVQRLAKKLTDATHKAPYTLWLGYSLDEVTRMSPSKVKYAVHHYPLIEKRIDTGSCYQWLKKNGFDIPIKSACIGCPFHKDETWKTLTDEELADASEFEKGVQTAFDRLKSPPYLHRSCIPISKRPFDTNQTDIFDDMCGGSCFT